jgi:Skp family chaperone for outer membrane proteins
MPLDVALIRQMNQRVQEELAKKEMEVIQYWLGEIQRVSEKRYQDLSGMQLDLKALVQKIQNRIKTLKSELSS